MTSTVYSPGVVVTSPWLNDVNNFVYNGQAPGGTNPSATGVQFLQAGTGAGLRSVQSKERDFVSVLDFFANGVSGVLVDPTGVVDSTLGIQAALTASKSVYMPAGTYKTTAPISVGADHTLIGAGKGITFLKPVGAFQACVQAIGPNYAGWIEDVVIGSFEIDGSGGFTGACLYTKYVGLRSRFFDIYGHSNTGKGLYTEGCFDHNYARLEFRACSSFGIHNFEKQVVPDGVYEETSKLIFTDCWALECNSGGIQWQVDGGDTFSFNECKPSEGTVGMAFTKNCLYHRVTNLMFDTPSAGTGIAIQVNAQFAQYLFINNVRGFQNQYDVQVIRGQNIYIQGVGSVNTLSSADGAIFLGPNCPYTDARSTPQTYPTDFISTWSPTLSGTGTSLGNGILVATYELQGHRLSIDFKLTVGSTTVLGNGFGFSLPISAAADASISGSYFDTSAATYFGSQALVVSGNVLLPLGAAFYPPVTIGAGDIVRVNGSYRIN